MNPLHRELALWAGGALALIIVLSWIASSWRADAADADRRLQSLYAEYLQLYAPGAEAERLPATAALANLEKATALQRQHLEAAETGLVMDLLPSLAGDASSTTTAITRLNEWSTAILRRAERMNLPPFTLPIGQEAFSNSNGHGKNHLLLAQTRLVMDTLSFIMDRNPFSIVTVEVRPLRALADSAYAVLGCTIAVVTDYPGADRLLRDLRSPEEPLLLREVLLRPRDDGHFEATLGVDRIHPMPEAWEALVGADAAGSAPPPRPSSGGRRRRRD